MLTRSGQKFYTNANNAGQSGSKTGVLNIKTQDFVKICRSVLNEH